MMESKAMRIAAKVSVMCAELLSMHCDDDSNALLGFIRYSMMWPSTPQPKAIIIAQSPYFDDSIIPYIASPFACIDDSDTPSIRILANTVCSVTSGDWQTTHNTVSRLFIHYHARRCTTPQRKDERHILQYQGVQGVCVAGRMCH